MRPPHITPQPEHIPNPSAPWSWVLTGPNPNMVTIIRVSAAKSFSMTDPHLHVGCNCQNPNSTSTVVVDFSFNKCQQNLSCKQRAYNVFYEKFEANNFLESINKHHVGEGKVKQRVEISSKNFGRIHELSQVAKASLTKGCEFSLHESISYNRFLVT